MSVDKRIKIVYMMTSCRNDGPVQQSLNVIKGLDLKKFEPILVTIYKEKEGNSRLDEFLPYVSKHYLVPMSKIDILLRKTSRMSEFLNQLKPDIIHTLGVFPDYLVSSIKSSYKQILVLRNYATDDYPDRYGRIKGRVLAKMQILAAEKADVVVACSESLQKIYQDKMNMKTVAIQNGVDTEKYAKILSSSEKEKLRKKMGISKNNFVWIYTGQFIGRKNIPFMIEGFLKASDKNDRMLLIGGGEKLDEMKKEYKDEGKLIFVGPVDSVRDYLEIADVYVSASRSEGLPNGVLEAMAMGLPVVLSGIPQHKELIVNEKESGGLSFELDDMDDYIAKLKSMRSDNVITIGKMARANVKENFDSRKTSKKYQDIYVEMCKPIRKITLFITSLSDGGAERVTCNLANYLSKHGYLVDVITMSSDAKDTYRLDDIVNRVCLLNENEGHFGKVRNFWIRQCRLKEYVKKNQNVSCYIVMLPITTFMLVRLKRFTSGKMIISDRINPASYNLSKRLLMKYVAKKADALVVQTKEIGSWYKNIKNKAIIPNAINDDVKLPKRGVVKKKIVAATGGSGYDIAGMSDEDLLKLLMSLFGKSSWNELSDAEKAILAAVLSKLGDMGYQNCARLAGVIGSTLYNEEHNKYIYLKYKGQSGGVSQDPSSTGATKWVSLKAVGDITDYRYVYNDTKQQSILTGPGNVYNLYVGDEFMYTGQNEDSKTITLLKSPVLQSGIMYADLNTSVSYFEVNCYYLGTSDYAAAIPASLEPRVTEMFNTLTGKS